MYHHINEYIMHVTCIVIIPEERFRRALARLERLHGPLL